VDNQPKMNIDINEADDFKCENCENIYFQPLIRLKRISPLISPTGKEAIYPVQVMSCAACGDIFNDLKE
tara:strand:- start:7641 stop:7847 length:207 start_codon:yes stop_codon:yes gene_type:complete